MKYTLRKLFNSRNPYKPGVTDSVFLNALKENIQSYMEKSEQYRKICEHNHFSPDQLKSIEDLYKIPLIPTLFLKRNDLSLKHSSVVEVTSSGTSGKTSILSYSLSELIQMLKMAIQIGRVHHLFSFKPTHYIVLGYQPTRKNKTVISKTAYLSTLYAPGISRRFALSYHNNKYHLDLDKLIDRLVYLSHRRLPVRIIGFPSYTYFLLNEMKNREIKLQLPDGSRILFGGGWKQFASQEISKLEMAQLVDEVLGIKSNQISEFFGAAEHPILYSTCRNGQFHIPIYARVIIRDIKTLVPVGYNQAGLLNLLCPIHSSLPIASVLTDDLAILREGYRCGCGLETDMLEILGRVGVQDVKTCSAGAQELLKEM